MKKPKLRGIILPLLLITLPLSFIFFNFFGWGEVLIELFTKEQTRFTGELLSAIIVLGFASLIFTLVKIRDYKLLLEKQKKTEKELLRLTERMKLLMKSSVAIIFNSKATGNFDCLYVSENITTILGYTLEEAYAMNASHQIVHPDDAPAVHAGMQAMLENGFYKGEYRVRHKNGSFRRMNADIKVVYDLGNNPMELIGSWVDITEKREIEQAIRKSEERFNLASRATRDVIYDWDMLTDNMWMSDEIFKSYGYKKEATDITLQWWEEKIHPDERNDVMNEITRILQQKGDSWSGNYRLQKADGTYADVLDRGYVVYGAEGRPLRFIGTMSNVTDIKRTESELRVAKEKAEDSAKAKSEFLANMSHEIRTPLNGIIGMTDMTLETGLNPDQKRYLEIVKTSCDSLMALINDILDFSKIDAGKMEISPVSFSLRDEVPRIMQPLGLKASHKQLEFVFSIEENVPDLLIGDIHRILQVITNLAGNAIKFTEKGEIVLHVQLKSIREDEAIVQFSISDTGIGIPKDKLSSVFEEFKQADGSTTRRYGGTGLGLAITKRLVELMGGNVWVESEENIGSAFHFTTVMKLQKQQQQRFTALPILDNTPVLVVEDNGLSREHLLHILENFRMNPLGVASGEEAIDELIRSLHTGQPYPLMMLDLSLTGKMDGFDVAEYVKGNPELKETNIIVITMSQKASDRERLAHLGIDKYFTKPFSQSDILDCIQNTLARINNNVIKKNGHPASLPALAPHSRNTYDILLVEDNLVNQEVAFSMLNKKGHTVVIANNGEEAVAMYKNKVFDFILMDVQMPLMNGYEATARIREIEKINGRHTLIIGLTANAMKGDREKCLEAGMDDYVSKPIRMNELFAVLEKAKQKETAPQTKTITATDTKPLVNLTSLLENLEGDKDMLEDILANYESRAMQQMKTIEMHVSNHNVAGIAAPAHSLKGQCMHVEMHAVVTLAGQMETLAVEKNFPEVIALMPSLQSELSRGLQALEVARMELRKEKVA